MPVDEERWPGPSEHEGPDLFRKIQKYMGMLYKSYGKTTVIYGYEELEEQRKKAAEEYIAAVEKENREKEERARIRAEERCNIKMSAQLPPTHVGPRSGSAFRKGKKQF